MRDTFCERGLSSKNLGPFALGLSIIFSFLFDVGHIHKEYIDRKYYRKDIDILLRYDESNREKDMLGDANLLKIFPDEGNEGGARAVAC